MKEQEKQYPSPSSARPEEAKAELRRRLRAERRLFTPEESRLVRHHLQSLACWDTPRTILSYHPLPDEPDLLPLLGAEPRHSWAFPRIDGSQLTLHRWSPKASWVTGASSPHGLCEPDPGNWPLISPEEIDIVLTPGLAFDSEGNRLGRGKGFYDRLLGLETMRALKIGMGRVIDAVPAQPHDIVMDLVASPEGMHSIGPSAPSMLDIRGKSI